MKHPYSLHVVNDEVNLITLLALVVVAALLCWLGGKLYRLIVAERERIKVELAAVMAGSLMTKDDFGKLYESVIETQSKLEYVEERLDAHLKEAQKIVGIG